MAPNSHLPLSDVKSDMDFSLRMKSLQASLSTLKKTSHGSKPVVTPAARTKALSDAIQAKVNAEPPSFRSVVDALGRGPVMDMGERLFAKAQIMQSQSTSMLEAANIRDQASAAALKAQSVITKENRVDLLPITMRACVAAEACAAAELKASTNVAWRLGMPSAPAAIPSIITRHDEIMKVRDQSDRKIVGPWKVPTRPRSESPVKSIAGQLKPVKTLLTPPPSKTAFEHTFEEMYNSVASLGRPAAERPDMSFGQSTAKQSFGQHLLARYEEEPSSRALDFYAERTKLNQARSEVKRIEAKLAEANEEVRRLQSDELMDRNEARRLRQARKEEEETMQEADRVMFAHKLRSRTPVGHVPHAAVDMAARVLNDEMKRTAKEDADYAVSQVARNQDKDWELSMAKQNTLVDHKYLDSRGSSGMRGAEATLWTGSSKSAAQWFVNS